VHTDVHASSPRWSGSLLNAAELEDVRILWVGLGTALVYCRLEKQGRTGAIMTDPGRTGWSRHPTDAFL
jgi:hypothetical protein